jgi:hypothetical protein
MPKCATPAGGSNNFRIAAMENSEAAIYYESPAKHLGYIGLGCIMLTASILCVNSNFRIAGWFFLPISGLFIFCLLTRLFMHSPRLIINKKGINAIRDGWGMIEWHEILDIEIVPYGDFKIIVLEVQDPEKFMQRLNMIKRLAMRYHYQRALGSPIVVTTGGLKGSQGEVLAAIERFGGDTQIDSKNETTSETSKEE